MQRSVLFFLLFLWPITLVAQKHDYIWAMGYDGGSISIEQPWFGITELHFSDFGKVDTVNVQFATTNFNDTNASICDKNGNPVFFFNGIHVDNSTWGIMENGDTLNPPAIFGYDLQQGAIAIPISNNQSKYLLFHLTESIFDGIGSASSHLYYSIIDQEKNNGLGCVILRKQLLIQDTLDFGKLTITRHANGRDWWLMVPKFNSNNIYTLLVQGSNIYTNQQEIEGSIIESGLGQAAFSPDGNWYAIVNLVNGFDEDDFLDLFRFDRCQGTVSNRLKINIGKYAYSGGVSFSKNSRFLYVSHFDHIYQYDLWAINIESSKKTVAIFDGFTDPFPTRFYLAQLAPDGKIYINIPNGTRLLHTIQYPDKEGTACTVKQHSFHLPTYNASSLPNFPNYRLGSIDGSPCDTLGIDNIPLANFRSDQDTIDLLKLIFTDLSNYEPADWFWEFGDGATSMDTSPVHIYQSPGVYEVCLTVSNANGNDQACDTLYLGVVNTTDPLKSKVSIKVFPNPTTGIFQIVLNDYYPINGKVHFYNSIGRLIYQQDLFHAWNTINTSSWVSGIYFYKILDGNVVLSSGKLIKS